jgi:hypothetical protein
MSIAWLNRNAKTTNAYARQIVPAKSAAKMVAAAPAATAPPISNAMKAFVRISPALKLAPMTLL